MSRANVLGIRVVLFLLASVVVVNFLNRVVFPVDPPDLATYPLAGDRFGSGAEEVKQQVVVVRDWWVVLRTQAPSLAPLSGCCGRSDGTWSNGTDRRPRSHL